MTPEHKIKKEILSWLALQKECMAFPVYNGAVFDPTRKIYRKPTGFFRKGVPDILGIWDGRPLAIEVKAGRGRATPEQKDFLKEFARNGGIAILAYSIDDVIKNITQAGLLFEEDL